MKTTNQLLLIIILLTQLTTCLLAATGQAGQEIAFLQPGVGARPLAMGKAFVAIANDANSPYYNPAGLAFSKHNELTSMQTKLATDVDYYYLSYITGTSSPLVSTPLNDRSASENSTHHSSLITHHLSANYGISWIMASVSGITLVDTTNATVTSDITNATMTDYYANAIMLAYGTGLTDSLAIGLSLTGFYQDFKEIAQGKGWGVTLTPGLLCRLSDSLNFGLTVQDALNYQKWDTTTTEIVIPKLKSGLAWQPWQSFLLAFEFEQDLDIDHKTLWYAGTEYTLNENLSLRAGYNDGQLSAGAGFKLGGLYADYAYIGQDKYELGETYRVSLGVKF